MLTQDRDTPVKDGVLFEFPAAAGVTLHRGALVVLENGFAKPGYAGPGLTAAGRCERQAVNAGADGEASVPVRRGLFRFANAAGDPVAPAAFGQPCYILDDETVAASDAGGTLSPAGIVRGVEALGVWVEI